MRKEFPRKVRAEAFARCGGYCEGENCPAKPAKLQTGKFIYDHRIPAWMGGPSTLDNCQVLCPACDKAKTRRDKSDITRVRKAHDRHIGARVSRNPMPFGRRSPLRKKINGDVVPR